MCEEDREQNMRIQKLIANNGYASRRQVEDMIKAGRVLVDGKVAKLGLKVNGKEIIHIDNKLIKYTTYDLANSRLLLFNKPVGVICSHRAMTDHPLIYDYLPRLQKGKWMSVGRLDLNSQGLLLVTNHGDLLQKLSHPKQKLKRVYKVRVRGKMTQQIINQMLKGIKISDQTYKFNKIEPIQKGNSNSIWHVTLFEGRNREVRELFNAFDCQVNLLKRIEYGPFILPKDLQPGSWLDVPFDVLQAKL